MDPVASPEKLVVASVMAQPAVMECAEHRFVLPICAFAGGPQAARQLAAVSRVFSEAIAKAWPELLEGFPCQLYVVGGLDEEYHPVATVDRFNPVFGAWERLPPLSSPRAGACAVVARGQLYVLGGEANGQALRDAQRFNPGTSCWELLPSMSAGRIRAAAVGAGSYVFVLGGLDSSRPLRSFERYELSNGKWQELPLMHRPRYACSATACGRWIFAFGGELSEVGVLSSMERYDRTTGRWELLPLLQAPCCGSATVLANDSRVAFSFGGLGMSGQALGLAKQLSVNTSLLDSDAWNPDEVETLRWGCMPPMPTPRHQTCAAPFMGGAVAVGGKGAKFEAVGNVEYFNSDSWSWDVLPNLPSPRLRAAVAGGRF